MGRASELIADEDVATTSGWWWRALSPVASPRSTAGQHSRATAGLTAAELDALFEGLQRIGQPGSAVTIPELRPLAPAMAWLARNEGLNRLAAEVVAAAVDRSASVWVKTGNEGRLREMADRYDFDLHVTD